MDSKKYFFVLFILAFSFSAYAQNSDGIFDAYRKYKDVSNLNIKVPTVVEVPFDGESISRQNFAVFSNQRNTYIPYYLKQNNQPIFWSLSTSPNIYNPNVLHDLDSATHADFYLPDTSNGRAQFIFSKADGDAITSSGITILLDNFVSLPNTVEIKANIPGRGEEIIVAKRRMDSEIIRFPRTTSNIWTINLTYSQPLRISEIDLNPEGVGASSRAIRFLAQPGEIYRIYFDPDRQAIPQVGEVGNLSLDKDVLKISKATTFSNPAYVQADVDKDGVADILDNCVSVSNRDQEDIDLNGRGDACDDFDRDGVINSLDNCTDLPNSNQMDVDGDKIGDVCDGKESRITEQYKWIPWVGIGFAVIVLVSLFALTALSIKKPPTGFDKDNQDHIKI